MRIARWLPSVFALICCGCEREEVPSAGEKLFYWKGSDPRVGSMTETEVATVIREIGSREYPVDVRELYPILPDKPEPHYVWNWEEMQTSEKSPFGGIVQDYWLNDSHVLRMTTAYYRKGPDDTSGRDLAWATILTASEAYNCRLNDIHTKHIDMIRFEYVEHE